MSINWSGVYPAVTTKFTKDEGLRYTHLFGEHRLSDQSGHRWGDYRRLFGRKQHASQEERMELLTATLKHVPSTSKCSSILQRATPKPPYPWPKAEAAGAHGIMLLPPMMYKATDAETVIHFRTVAAATQLPILLYNNPVDYKIEISLDMFEALAPIKNIEAVKESTRDISNVTRLKNRFGDRFKILCGVDTLAMEELLMGADGWVAGLVDAFPAETVAIFKLIKAGRTQEASRYTDGSCRYSSWTSRHNWCKTSSWQRSLRALARSMSAPRAKCFLERSAIRVLKHIRGGDEEQTQVARLLKPITHNNSTYDYCQRIGNALSSLGQEDLQSVNPATQQKLPECFAQATKPEIDMALQKAHQAWKTYRDTDAALRAKFLKEIATEIENHSELVARVMLESGLPEGRVVGGKRQDMWAA